MGNDCLYPTGYIEFDEKLTKSKDFGRYLHHHRVLSVILQFLLEAF